MTKGKSLNVIKAILVFFFKVSKTFDIYPDDCWVLYVQLQKYLCILAWLSIFEKTNWQGTFFTLKRWLKSIYSARKNSMVQWLFGRLYTGCHNTFPKTLLMGILPATHSDSELISCEMCEHGGCGLPERRAVMEIKVKCCHWTFAVSDSGILAIIQNML